MDETCGERFLETAVSLALYGFAAVLLVLCLFFWLEDSVEVVLSFVLLFAGAAVGGAVAELCALPALLGYLVFGFILRNVHEDVLGDLHAPTAATLRAAALGVILVRAGMGLNLGKLRALGGPTLRLSFVPVVCESVIFAVLARLLFDMDWAFCFSLGFALVRAVCLCVCCVCVCVCVFAVAGGIRSVQLLALSSLSFERIDLWW